MSIRPIRHLRGALASVALATVSLTPFALAATADARPAPAKPTIVLVHGAFADASGFAGVIDRLRDDGYPVRAAPNPLLGLAPDAATVRGFLDSIKGPKIVVGHSYGGAVITQAASGGPDVKALVYLAALAPDRGEVLGELVETPVAHPPAPMPLIPVNVTQADGTQRTDLYLDPSKFRDRFAADVPARVADDLAATQRPLSMAAFTSALTVEPAWKTIPSWYLVSRQDRVMAPELERLQAHRMHAHTREVDSSHAVYLSHPKAVTDLVEQAARATR
jgi:pimeloyl-ACP methyl ester carboxylesterase